jgi:hypothetical protein
MDTGDALGALHIAVGLLELVTEGEADFMEVGTASMVMNLVLT